MSGALCLVLHAHQPFVRRHGAWPCGEDWYHQAASESYAPLADAFGRLADDGLSGFATVSFTPVLASQMADAYMTRELSLFAGRTMLRAERQAANYRGPERDAVVSVAAAAHLAAGRLAERLEGAWSTGTHVPWRALAGAGVIETWTSAPTHSFLPALADDGLIEAGFRAAVDEHLRVFGIAPAGAWLPELAYRPGLERCLRGAALDLTLVDGPAFDRAGADRHRPGKGDGVTFLARDREASLLVSGPGGYPGRAAFRDFHHYDSEAGFKSFAVTNPPGERGPKAVYDARVAEAMAADAAAEFRAAVETRLGEHRERTGRPGVLVAAFDAELFGHWWFEGVRFLEEVVRGVRADGRIGLVTASEAAAADPVSELVLPASTWGRAGDDSSWVNAATEPIWLRVRDGQERLRATLGRGADRRVAAQAVREWLLLASSDWPYMVTMGRAADYARDRVIRHDRALSALCEVALRGVVPAGLEDIVERDNLLPDLDPSVFGSAEGPVLRSPAWDATTSRPSTSDSSTRRPRTRSRQSSRGPASSGGTSSRAG